MARTADDQIANDAEDEKERTAKEYARCCMQTQTFVIIAVAAVVIAGLVLTVKSRGSNQKAFVLAHEANQVADAAQKNVSQALGSTASIFDKIKQLQSSLEKAVKVAANANKTANQAVSGLVAIPKLDKSVKSLQSQFEQFTKTAGEHKPTTTASASASSSSAVGYSYSEAAGRPEQSWLVQCVAICALMVSNWL